jgi:hypothetical protein
MQRALCSSIIKAGNYLHKVHGQAGFTVERGVKSGVVRWDGSSLAAIRFEQYFDQHVLNKNVDKMVREDEDQALKTLRFIHQLTGELDRLRETGAFGELLRDKIAPLYRVGDILEHKIHGLVVVYGWDANIDIDAQSFVDPTKDSPQLLVDNRLFFASIERGTDKDGLFCSYDADEEDPYYRVMTTGGIAHYCHERLLEWRDPLPSKSNFEPVMGTTFFFEGSDGTRYFPNTHMQLRYPHDVPAAAVTSAVGAVPRRTPPPRSRSLRRG